MEVGGSSMIKQVPTVTKAMTLDISIDEYLAWTPASIITTTATRPSKGTVAAAVAAMTATLLRGVSN